MEYYLKDIGEYNYMTDTWVYYVSANERLAKLSNSTPTVYYAYDQGVHLISFATFQVSMKYETQQKR
jgi:hypothetical protein